jgi:putative sterol carrier protein
VASFLNAEWFEALNATLEHAGPPPKSESGTPFRVVFEFTDAPATTPHAVTFVVSGEGARAEAGDHLAADAVIRLTYRDGEALTQGTLDSANALREGRVKIRGDVHGLVPLLSWLLGAS